MTQPIDLITLLKELHTISGFRISIYDIDRNEICAYPKELTLFCSNIQNSKAGKKKCTDCDAIAFYKVQETKEAYIYRCHYGLYEAVAPLYHFGVLSGYLMMGQTLDTMADSASYVYQKSLPFFSDPNQLSHVISRIPISSKEKISSCITIMKICASYITESHGFKIPNQDLPQRLQKYLNKNYAFAITIDKLSSVFLCSKSTLSNAFRNAFDQSIIEYLTEVRLMHAKDLLENQSLSIKNIAIACGYPDQNYFTKVFQKNISQTPSEYRNDALHNK